MLPDVESSFGIARRGTEIVDGRAQRRTRQTLVLLPAVFTAVLCCSAIALTLWCVHDAAAHPHQRISAGALLICVGYLLLLVAAIRLLCLGGMLVSYRADDAEADLMPRLWFRNALHGRLRSLPARDGRVFGYVVLAEAALVFVIWACCIGRLWQIA